MKRSGWYGDSWRHSLAAKGMKSKYFSPKSYFQQSQFADATMTYEDNPFDIRNIGRQLTSGTVLRREQDDLRLQAFREQQERQRLLRESPGGATLENVRAGDLSDIRAAIDETTRKKGKGVEVRGDIFSSFQLGTLTSSQQAQLRAEANKQALDYALQGVPVPEELNAIITQETKNRINAIKREQKLESSAATRLNRELTKRTFEGIESGVRGGISAGVEGLQETSGNTAARIAANDVKFKEATSTLQKNSSLFDTLSDSSGLFPDISDNVFLGGDGDPGIGKLQDNGAFDFLSLPAAETSPLSSAIVPREKFKGVDFGIDERGGPARTFADQVSDKVESLWSNRKELGKVDRAPLKKGQKAFERGDREKLIEAINEQEFQIKQQESRWKLVNQTRVQVESGANHEAALNKKQGLFGFDMFGSSGGKQLAEQTRKINEVTKSVKQGADDARARAQVLRGNLQRLDATVPFDDSVPKEDVKLFKKEFSFADLVRQRGTADEGK